MVEKPANELTLDDLEEMDDLEACRGALKKGLGVFYKDIGRENEEVYRKRSATMAQWGGYALGRLYRAEHTLEKGQVPCGSSKKGAKDHCPANASGKHNTFFAFNAPALGLEHEMGGKIAWCRACGHLKTPADGWIRHCAKPA